MCRSLVEYVHWLRRDHGGVDVGVDQPKWVGFLYSSWALCRHYAGDSAPRYEPSLTQLLLHIPGVRQAGLPRALGGVFVYP